ncbi:Sodium/hydrogen exchanger 9B2 [Irineochytrium annulatum]|nr:Sodium/hydrogen exchanger 9B2 [Irineochytrium annulatum]
MTMEGSDKKLRKGGKPSLMSLSLLVAFTMLVSACWNAYISTPDPEYLLSARSEIIPNAAAVAALGNGGGAAAAVAALAHPESPDNPIAQGSPPVDDLEDAVIDAVEPSEPDAEKPAPAIAPPQPPPKAVVPPAAPQPKAQNPPAAAAPFEPAPPPPIIPSPVLLPHRVPPQGFEAPAQPPPRPTKVLRNPSTSTFSLLLSLSVVVMLGVLGGRVADKFRQAPMLGMLVSGVLARNLFPSIVLPLPHSWTAQFWTVALSAVVARAGLSLQAASMRANLVPTLMLGSIPILVEAIFLASLVGWVFRLPTEWCFTLAFGVASISPGVVVPLLLNLLDNASWKGSRLPPLLLASTGLDVLVATTCFGVSVAAVFGHKHEQADHEEMVIHASWLARGLEEVIAGVFGGCSLGALSFYLSRVKIAEPVATAVMFVLTTLGMMYGKTHGFPGAASSSVIITWAIIANVWEREAVEVANKRLKLVWKFAEPFLFPLIGASVSLIEIPPKTIFLAMICVAMSVLAALSTVTIEAVHSRNLQGTADDARARIVFACMVAAIMIGAPFAASWVAAFGTRVPKVGPSGNGSSVHGGTKGGILGVELSMHELKEDEK